MNLFKDKVEAPAMKQIFRKRTVKSRAGVKYIKYVPELVGKPRVGPNRAQRRSFKRMEQRMKSTFKKRVADKQHEIDQKAKRERIAKRFPQREYYCKFKKCEKRNRKGGYCNEHQPKT